MDKLQEAINMAIAAHSTQIDKSGVPYINHPIYVMSLVKPKLNYQIAAILHDVLEDSNLFTLEEIKDKFGHEVSEAVDALTKRESESRVEYILRISKNIIAIDVKLADLHHNSSKSRGWYRVASIERYHQESMFLLSALKEWRP